MKIIEHDGVNCQVHDDTDPTMFKELTSEEKKEFLEYASHMMPGTVIKPIWHPILQDYLYTEGRGVEG